LLAHGVDVNARNKDGSTPLHIASSNETFGESEKELAIARALLAHGADIGAEDDKGRTAFQVAEETGYDEMMRLLSEYVTN
jgi:ankyrin repeat protein